MADRYDPETIEPKWQRVWADEHTWEVSNDPYERPKAYVLEMLPVPVGRAAHRSPEELLARRRGRPLPAAQRRRACSTRWATTPSACRPRTTRSRPASTRASRPRSRSRQFQRAVPRLGRLDRLDARVRHARAARLPLDPVDLPAPVRARPRLPQGGGGQVVPERPDRARQRAGDRRPLRALRPPRSRSASSSSGSSASPTTPTACSTTSRRSTGRAHVVDDAAELDRPLRGRRGRVPLRGARHRLPGLHDAARTRCSAPPSS